MSTGASPVYFIIGTPGSGRRALVRDLVENGLEPADPALVLLAESETSDPVDQKISGLPSVTVQRWQWTPEGLPAVEGAAEKTIFFLADSRVSPVDQLEALKPWLEQQGAELARVFFVVDCQLAEKTPILKPWFAACIYFSDVVFLAKREGVANKWMSDFIRHFTDEHYPCHFIPVKKGDLPNPALVLDPSPRRVSQYFEEGEVYEIEGLETDDDEEDDEDADTGLLPEEPYFKRDRSGRREKELPDFREYLAPQA